MRFDYVLKTMSEIGLRAIICLTNYWPDYGGMQWCASADQSKCIFVFAPAQI